jgi:hypothetical protein
MRDGEGLRQLEGGRFVGDGQIQCLKEVTMLTALVFAAILFFVFT